ncbi:DUF3311 domain-containing protein [Nocardia sp. NEAU-G5]|uniref:DUF3311 domain-containing protein n=1 Tax=Nocardia albiluteola TaxID=2842303 RepID=A0ABS6AUE3_9NOCA|nr:DUF3311 domain-containing protein [Nocardia albiluteola]MBU3061508.1 DUF3311 domain-containing protein [Nocardia albiluteola]
MPDSTTTPAPPPGPQPIPLRRRGRILWLLTLPGVLYCLAPFVANRIEPRVAGIPFLVCYLLIVTALTGPLIGLVARFDPAYRSGAPEYVPADDARDPA